MDDSPADLSLALRATLSILDGSAIYSDFLTERQREQIEEIVEKLQTIESDIRSKYGDVIDQTKDMSIRS